MASGWRAGRLDVDIFRWSDFLQSRTGSLDRVYTSDGNTPLIALLDRGVRQILDVAAVRAIMLSR
jgi:hypothetical protein